MKKGSKEAKAWGRKMKRLRAKKSTPKRRKSATKRRKTTTTRKRVKRGNTMARRKRTYSRRKSGKAFNMRNLLLGMGAGTAVATVAGNNPLFKGGAGFLIAGLPGAVGAVALDYIGGSLNLGAATGGTSGGW